jgi:3-oxoacyl-[acyl-carrier protein] reductase
MSELNRITDFEVGASASFSVTITQDLVDKFVLLTGDDNPLHVDPEFAREAKLGRPVVHGMLSASFVSTLVGKHIPGDGALWVSQEFQFLKPVMVADVLEFSAKVLKIHTKLNALTLAIGVRNQHGIEVLTGKGMVKSLAEKVTLPVTDTPSETEKGYILITGASGAIGSEIARVLAAQGYPLILQYQRNANSAQRLAHEIETNNGIAHCLQADLRLAQELPYLAKACMGFGKPLSGFVHCASLPINSIPIASMDWDAVSDHIDVAGRAFYVLAKELTHSFAEANNSSIVAISTQALEESPTKGWMAYLTGKSVLTSIVRSLAIEYGPLGIRANLVSPGMVETELVSDIPERTKLTIKQNTPVRRLCQPIDIANAVSYLISDKSSFVSGETIRVNGGISIH